jgi:hypothetical protein
MTEESSLLVDCKLTKILDENKNTAGEVVCAEPVIDDAAVRILQLAGNTGQMRELGRRARAQIEAVSEAGLEYNRRQLFGRSP